VGAGLDRADELEKRFSSVGAALDVVELKLGLDLCNAFRTKAAALSMAGL